MLQPLRDRVLIKPDVPPDTTESGLHLVSYWRPENCGEIAFVPERIQGECPDCGARLFQPPAVTLGDVVVFSPNVGQEVTIDGTKYLVMREADILGVLEGAPA